MLGHEFPGEIFKKLETYQFMHFLEADCGETEETIGDLAAFRYWYHMQIIQPNIELFKELYRILIGKDDLQERRNAVSEFFPVFFNDNGEALTSLMEVMFVDGGFMELHAYHDTVMSLMKNDKFYLENGLPDIFKSEEVVDSERKN